MNKTLAVAAAGFYHESNTLVEGKTGHVDFLRGGIERGDEVAQRWARTESALGGFLGTSAFANGVDPILSAWANPSGIINGDVFTNLLDELCERLAARRWDAVLLSLHGAAVAEGVDNADQEILRRVRQEVGDDTVIGVCFDPHGNISHTSISAADIVVAYRTNPHVDARASAERCCALVKRCVVGDLIPRKAVIKSAEMINILRQNTSDEPLHTIQRSIWAREGADVLVGELFIGYPYADVADAGPTILVITDDDQQLADRTARELLPILEGRGRDLRNGAARSPREAVNDAQKGRGSVLLLDTGDNIGGGAPGDSTTLLHELTAQKVSPWLTTIVDAEAVDECIAAGEGNVADVSVGGRVATHDLPYRISGRVLSVASGRYRDSATTHGGLTEFDMGPTAVLETKSGDVLVVASHPVIDSSVERYRSVRLAVTDFKIVVAKGVHSPLPSFEPLMSACIFVDTPGVTTPDLRRVAEMHRSNRRSP